MRLITLILYASLPALACLCTACDRYETDHPQYGKIVSLTTDWTDRGAGIDIPASYTLTAGRYTTTLTRTQNTIENLFEPGRYGLHLYNTPNGISVNDNRMVADYTTGLLGWAFTGMHDIAVEKDRDYYVTVVMRQQVRQLNLELEITGDAAGRLTGIDATLSGVAGGWNIDLNSPSAGSAATAPFSFEQANGQFGATIRLLGILGNAQELSLTLRFAEDNPASYTVTSNLSALLAGFNDEKITPLTLSAIVVVTPTQGGPTSTVSDWVDGGLSEGVAD